jgi:1A family penicillin-binding protein
MGRKTRRWLPPWLRLIVILALIAGFFGGGLVLFWVATLEIPDFSAFHDRVVSESTKIYDRTGEILLYDVHGTVRRQIIPFEEISKDIKNATVAIEDSEFYEHRGFKPDAFLRAVFANLLSASFSQGGSTITQQLVKNTILTQEKKIARKVKEIVLALKMEQTLSKEQILTLYLNETPYGGNIYGVEEASRAFFGKSAKDISLAEAAYVAAIPQAPTFFSPYGKNRERLEERKNLVLRRMREIGFIDEAQEAAAKAEVVIFQPLSEQGIKAPHFVIYVRDYLAEKYGEENIKTRGFKVITTLDWELQEKAEEIVARYATENIKNFNAHNAGLVAIDPQTGQILAMVGSRDYFDTEAEGNFNITLAHRQPGSAFKPFVYAQALSEGFTPETVLFDVPTQFDTACARDASRCYAPSNYDNIFRGPMTIRTALAQSINIPAIKALYLAGVRDSINLARSMGISSLTDPNRYGLTLVLGGGEVSLLELTGAYGVFANEGVRLPPEEILRVEDSNGEVLEEFEARPQTALAANVARQISSILSDNAARQPTFSANSPLYFPGRDVAAKTGTTNDYRDAWIVGYTPNLAVGTWAGNNDNTPMEKKIAGLIVAPMWREFMNAAIATRPVANFTPPEPTSTELPPVYRGFWQGNRSYVVDKVSGKLATEYTPEELREERVVQEVHSLLYWLDRRGDAQFDLWERPVRAWAIANGHLDQTGGIPDEPDDIHRPENQPRFEIDSPHSNQTYQASDRITVAITDYQGKYPLGQVEVFFNDTFLDSAKSAPFQITFRPSDLEDLRSRNTLRVVVYDAVRNQAEETINLKVDR